jgi:hypothetical protein
MNVYDDIRKIVSVVVNVHCLSVMCQESETNTHEDFSRSLFFIFSLASSMRSL